MNGLVKSLRRPVTFSSIDSSELWNSLRWTSRRWRRRLGWPGVLAIGILAICTASYFYMILPAQAKLDMARHSATMQREHFALASRSLKGRNAGPEAQLAEYYKKFPAEGLSPQWLEKLVALAATCGLSLNDGEYELMRDKAGRLVRYQMTLPVRGEYPQIRKFLTDLPGAIPVIALENVQFERQKVADSNVEAKIKLVLYLEPAS